ncbi:MARTX multifunctional-autoprocessing repeats-in-toxin holotoxin RtxA [Vibrio aestuarianus]|nr:MARTX multifunctional-autoprocessing repeats-in-toxin holotoxin RtxA [Vibrio aestuarianus]MDE1333242.1 MARTX multifunctional-autoprocessing repeats-in-toxin holotoxin RtxA [Vibrio aestuarianus]
MGDVVDFFEDVGDWIEGAAEDTIDWFEGAAKDTIDWVENAAEDVVDFVGNDVKDFFETDVKNFLNGVGQSLEFFITGVTNGDDGDNTIVALGFGGTINAYGGNDEIITGGFYVDIYTGSGDDNVYGAGGGIDITDTDGNLGVYGASGSLSVNKTGNGNIDVGQASVASVIVHTGANGDLAFGGASACNKLTRKGLSGNVTFKGAGGYNALWHETNQGNLSFAGAGAGNKLDRTWFNRYQDSRGDVTFDGAGAANSISSRVETGNITFRGAGADNHLVRKGKVGDVTLQGAGASNRIERTRQAEDVYAQTRGNIRFEGVGGYNSLYSDVAHGDIHFSGGGAYNTITRKGSGSSFDAQGMEYAKAEEIVLTAAQMHGLSIDNGNEFHAVTAVKSEREPNTYLFAIADVTYTKINKVRLYNDPETGKLKYYSEAWFKRGNHLTDLARSDVSSAGGFDVNPINGGYTLSNIAVEHQQSLTVHAVEKDLTEYEWVTYANGALIDAKDVALSEAKMGGIAISTDGTTVDVQAVKSNRKPNTYVYAKVLGPYTKIVVVELANDPKTGALKYQARSWYKDGDHTADLANEDISSANGYHSMGKGGYSLSDLHYSVNAVRSTSETVADIDEYTDQTLFKPATDSGESSGDVRFNGAGGGNVIKSNVTRGNVYFNGGGIANVILHSSQFGHTEFNGGGAANVIVKSGEEGDLTFRGAGLANVLVHQSKQGKMDVYAGGAVNVLVRIGDGQYLAHLLAYGNISVHKGNGNSRVVMLGGYNTHTQIGSGNGLWLAAGGFNVMTQVGKGDVASVLAGGANVLTKVGDGDLTAGMLGGANVITHISGDNETSNTTAVALGGANILTKKGKGNALAVMGGGANVLTHVGDGTTTGVMVGGANILTKVGNGDTTGIMLGVGNVLTHVGDGQTLGVMGAVGNIFTKVGDGTSIAVMIGAGNIFTHVGEGNAWALMGGLGNVFTKVGNGDALALMVAEANVFTHIGDGMSVALMLAKGNVATKVGNGTTLAAMVGNANIFTHVGSGSTFAAMIGQANIMTKVGDDLTAALMVGKANIYTHVGDGTSLGIFAGEVNVMTKVGNGTTLAAMFGKANIMTHVGDGLTGVLALGEANIVTKVGDDFMGVVAAAKANVVTHVGDATTAAVLAGKGNILTKVGEGTTVGLLISDIGNVMTHVGDGTTIGIAKGKANIITKVGDGLGVNVAWGQANVFTQVGDGDRYNFAKGEANVITKVGDGQEVSVVQGKANIITHVGNGDDYTGAWGKANVITKVGNGRNVVLAKGEANIVTQVGDGDSFNALWSKGNIVTKVGDGMQVTAAKGKANITTTVGDGLSVTAAYGDANINTKVGDGVSVNVAWGKYNINTKVGDGLNVAVMKGKANANIHIGDGLGINVSYAQNNVAIKVGNGDFYSLAVASSNTSSNKLSALFDNIKQTILGVGGSQAINYLVQGDEASSSGTQKGRGAIATPEITKLDGFQMDAIEEVGSDLGDSLTGSVTKVDTPDLNKMQNTLNVDGSSDQTQAPNLIVNGDFEQGDQGWKSTHGVEASHSGNVYGVNGEGHGARVTELDTYTNTSLYQDLTDLTEGEVIAVSFDFAKRAGLSNNEGIEVLWNGEVVFSSSGDESAWQQKTLKLTAHAGSNRIEFKGTGHDDGFGYILDNVVAKSETLQQTNAVSEHATQNQASQNALSDKDRAEADRQRLEQEKQKQIDAVAGSQSQLESTDQQALENNGQSQRDAVKEESEAVTAELTKLAQGLDVLDGQATHTGESGDQWRNDFAGGLLDGVQRQLDDAKQLANDKIAAAKQTQSDNNSKVKESVAKSEAGVAKGEQNRAGAEQDIADAKADAETRKADAVAKSNDAKQAESDAHSAANDAQSRGDRDAMNAENKANQAQNDAKGTKQNEGDRPDREGVTGSGLSGNAHRVEGAGETGSHVTNDSQTNADGRFSEGLSEQEQEALEGATNAVNRLQINAGIRGKNSGSTISSMFTETNTDSIVVPTTASQDVVRKEIRISGVNLEGLGEASHDSAESLVAASHQSAERALESLGEGKQTTLDLSSVSTKDELKNEAKVFAKPIGESYQKILDQLDLLHTTQGDKQIEAALRVNNLVDDYVSHHEKSGRNSALLSLKNRVSESLYNNVAQETRVEIAKLSATRIDLAADLLHRLRSSTNKVSSVVDIKHLADGTKYSSQESLAVLSKQEVPFNKELQDQQLVQGRETGEAVVNNVQLSDDEIKGIKWYTSEGFQYVNEALRKEEKLAYFVKDNAVNAVKGLSKLETFEGTVYRAFMPGVSLSDLASQVTPGQLFSDQGFTSTSTSTELAKSFRGGKDTVILTILDAKGTNVAGLAQLNQAEVLLKPGAHLRIEAVKETDQNLHIVAKYTEEFHAGETIRNLFDGKTIGMAINQNTSTINESVITSFDHDEITTLLKNKPVLGDAETVSNADSRHKSYQSRDLVLEPIVQPETIELGMPDIDQKILAEVAERRTVGSVINHNEAREGEQGSKVVHTIDTLPSSEILDQVIRDLNKSSTLMSETNFYDPKKFESDSVRVKVEWKQTLTNINNIRSMYFPHDMARYFEALKDYKVGNCGDRALYAAHLIMDKYNFQGEVELLKLKGSGDHVFVRVGGTSDSAKIIDPWTGQHFAHSQIKTFLYNPKEKKVEVHRSFDNLKALFNNLHLTSLNSLTKVQNHNVENWENVVVIPIVDGGETRFDGQIIVQMENDSVAAKAAANLAGKHPENSVVVQLDSDGNYRVVYGDPSKLDGKLRWQLVGHGRDDSEHNNTRLSGYSADELAVKLAKFQQAFGQAENISNKPDHISIVGCSLVSDDKQKGFGHQFINAMDANGLRVDVSVRNSDVAVDTTGRKHTQDANGNWVQKAENNKVSLTWNTQGEVTARDEIIRNGVAEGDIHLSRVGASEVNEPARGAIGDNSEVFEAPEKRKTETDTTASAGSDNKLSYSGNIQVNVGDGEFTAVNWGTSNVGIKVGTGGFKSLAFGDNNVMVHIGNGESKHSFDIGGYQALEGAQMFIGNRNVSFNLGRSNDLIVMMDKSIPTPPLVNPFDGAARISGVLQSIAQSGKGADWLAAQEQQWTLSGAKKFVKEMSGLDQTSSVDYTSLVELDSQNERSSRGLKSDAEATLNKKYNQWLSGNSNNDSGKMSRADKFRQMNEKLAFNFAVGGQGADIQVTTGNWNFMFGDNIQSILDTNLGSLFGLMTQQFSATGQAKTTFTYTPEDLPRQLKNKLLGQLAGVGAETTLADIFGVDYTASGHIVSRNGEAVDGVAILKEMLEVIGEFSGDQLQAFVDPAKLLDSLKSGINMGADGIKSFAETHGLKEKSPEEEEDNSSVSVNGANVNSAQGATVADASTETAKTPDRAFGFNSLNLPNLFATIFSQDKQKEMKSLVENLKENLTADLLNMKEKTFDFLRNSGHLQGDGDINLSLGNYNFNWGGDGKDLGAYLGDNNNFWGGRGDDVFYATGTSNIFTGGEGNDMGVLMGRENMMFGGDGNDTAVVAGRINHVFLGAGDDQSFVFGEGGEIDTGSGRDYVVTSGNFNRVDTGDDQDYSVTIGNNNQVELGAGNDFANVFGNYNRINASAGNDVVKLMGYHAVLNGGEGEDHLIAAAISKFSQFNGGEGRDLMVLGGYQNTFKGGTDVDSFVVSGDVIDNLVEDIRSEDNIVFNGIDWQKLWFERSGYDLKLSILRDPASDSDQAKFEHIGSVTFSDYFNGNRAQVIIAMGEKDATGEREYTTLSESAIDALVQAMSGFEPQAGDNGFIDNLDSKSRVAITTAWSDVSQVKSAIA